MSMDLYFAQQAMAGNLYRSSNIVATASTALNATHTGLVLSNPVASGINLIVKRFTYMSTTTTTTRALGLCVAPAVDADDTAHTTPCVVHNGLERGSNVNNGVGTVDESATLANTPVALMPVLWHGSTAAGENPMSVVDFDGSLILPPGTYIATFHITAAVTGSGTFEWVEQATSNTTINP